MRLKRFVINLVILILLLMFVRQIPKIVMSGHLQLFYYHVLTTQNFAKEHNKMFLPKLYRAEVRKYIERTVPGAEREMDNILSDANKLYYDFLNNPDREKQTDDYSNKIDEYERHLETVGFDVYADILHITDKYLLIPFGGLPTDYSGALAEVFMPYFKKYNIDDTELVHFELYLIKKQDELFYIKEQITNNNKISVKHGISSSYIDKLFNYFTVIGTKNSPRKV